ncbi:MAG: YicC family protein [Clostridia bacterium]|nr:YicC family protein [Clostridia bacterium]
MIKSMTGFGRAKEQINNLDITVEIKSVNHRYFEFSSRMPRAYQFLEEKLKSACHQSITRGKVELSLIIEDNSESSSVVEINRPFAKGYIAALKQLAKDFKIKDDVKVSTVALNPEIFKIKRQSLEDEEVTQAVLAVTNQAIESFIAMREIEGEKLAADILSRAQAILSKVSLIEERSPETVKAYRERLEAKIKELLADAKVDEQRLITETALFADKVAVDEETVRLRSHIDQLSNLLKENSAVGKKLDFIVQEMNRETNTIGSKCQDVDISHTVVDIKSEIEKIREQVQNIE